MDRRLSILLLAWIAGICLSRGITLIRDPHRLTAHEERAWFAWAVPRSDAAELFGRAAAELSPGEVICLEVPRTSGSLDWYRFMANYYLPDQGVAAVRHRGSARPFPPQATIVTITGSGEVQVRRGGRLGQPG